MWLDQVEIERFFSRPHHDGPSASSPAPSS